MLNFCSFFFLSFLFASFLTLWRGPTATTIPLPIVSTFTPLKLPFPRPHRPRHRQPSRNQLSQPSRMPVVNESGSSRNWNAPTPPPTSVKTWERKPRRRLSLHPLLLSYPQSTGTPSKGLGCFVDPEFNWDIPLWVGGQCLVSGTYSESAFCFPDPPLLKSTPKLKLHDHLQPRFAAWILYSGVWVHHWLACVTLATHATWTPSCSVCATPLPWLSTSTTITTWKTSIGQGSDKFDHLPKDIGHQRILDIFVALSSLLQVQHPWP